MDQERAVLSVFHKTGVKVIQQDRHMYEVFDCAAVKHPEVFGDYSLVLSEGNYLRLATFISKCVTLGIFHRDPRTLAIMVSEPLANGYGANLFYDLDNHVKECVMEVAAKLRDHYGRDGGM